jgi:hypothetical protein
MSNQLSEDIKADNELLLKFQMVAGDMLRGVWTSPDTTPKKTNWFIQCHNNQVAGQPAEGRIVYVTKSRGAFQIVQLLEKKADKTDKNGLPVSLWTATVLNG